MSLAAVLHNVVPSFYMDLKEEIQIKQKRKNEILIAKDSVILEELNVLLSESSPKTVIYWALRESERIGKQLEQSFRDPLFLELSDAAWRWAKGERKMHEVKPLILAVHGYAKKTDDAVLKALCHAMGQGCSTVHKVRHAPGLAMYEMTALVKERGTDDLSYLFVMKEYYMKQVLDAAICVRNVKMTWAKFIEKREIAYAETKNMR